MAPFFAATRRRNTRFRENRATTSLDNSPTGVSVIAVAIELPNTLSPIGLAFFFALIRSRLESFDFLELARGFLLSSQLLVAPRQQITGLGVLRLLARRLLQHAHGFRRPPLFEEDASRQRQRLDRLRLLR